MDLIELGRPPDLRADSRDPAERLQPLPLRRRDPPALRLELGADELRPADEHEVREALSGAGDRCPPAARRPRGRKCATRHP